MESILNNLTTFILQSNPINIAVGVSLGASFTVFIASVTQGLIVPVLSIIFGKYDFSKLSIRIKGNDINFGLILNSLLYLVIVVVALLFFVIEPINLINQNLGISNPLKSSCPFCKTIINVDANVCPACTQLLPDNWSK